jgi:ribose 5-phosphate isomerase RpiB
MKNLILIILMLTIVLLPTACADKDSGKADEVYEAMLIHRSNLTDETFYPQGQKAAAAAIVGKSGKIVYLICDERAQTLEAEILGYIEDKPDISPAEIYENLTKNDFYDTMSTLMNDINENRYAEFQIDPENVQSVIAKEAAISSFFVQLIIIEAN